jgi:hypothetical protein
MTNSFQAVFVMPFLHAFRPKAERMHYEKSLAVLCSEISVISEIWNPPKFHVKGDHKMSFNYAAERNKFDAAWEKLRKEYADAGMPEENIELMYQFDLKQFNTDRAYVNHTCPLNLSHEQMGENDDFENPFLEKYLDQFTTQYDTYGTHSRYWWLEELSDPRLVAALPMLTREDKELLTLYFVERFTIREIAKGEGKQKSAVSERLLRLLTLIKNT